MAALYQVKGLHKAFCIGGQNLEILKGLDFEINEGDFTVIFGPSGCGKSTLLHTLLGLEKPTSGEVTFRGENIYKESTEDERSEFRKQHIGMVYQQPNWIKSLSVLANVSFPLLLRGVNKVEAYQRGTEILRSIGMDKWASYNPADLSGGQQQRIAMMRALIVNPDLVIADEPTGNLDYESGVRLMEYLLKINKEAKKAIVMVTHDLEYLKYATVAIKMFDGAIKDILTGEKLKGLKVNSKRGITN
jgi:putative ABC transport system ATP-binding protein